MKPQITKKRLLEMRNEAKKDIKYYERQIINDSNLLEYHINSLENINKYIKTYYK